MNRDSTELLPCPFCGGEARYSERMGEDIATHDIVLWRSVACSENDCANIEWPDGYEGGTAIKRWNTRSAQPIGEEMVERVANVIEAKVGEGSRNYTLIARAAITALKGASHGEG